MEYKLNNHYQLLAITIGCLAVLCGGVPGEARVKSRFVANLAAGKAQTIVTYGTSLTAGGAWVWQLSNELNKDYPGLATVINSGAGAMWSKWGIENLDDRVISKKPDAVFIEFSINDAYSDYKMPVSESRANLNNMIDRILASNKSCEIIIMVMDPPINEHLVNRPHIKDYNQMYRDVARQRHLILIDHYAKWEKILKAGRYLELVPDGIHPNDAGCALIITPGIIKALGIGEKPKVIAKNNAEKLFVVINGESNSGGIARNADALPSEIGVRKSVKILNNTTLASFDDLNIGVNNLIGHTGIPADNGTHGWELELANWAEKQTEYSKPVYLIKTGHGGSRIAEWNTSGFYYTTFMNRLNAAKRLLKGEKYKTVVLFTLGLNDTLAGTDVTVWKAGVTEHFKNLRRELGADTPIIMTRFMAAYPVYNKAIEELCKEIPNTYSVETQDLPLQDTYHWNYVGMKTMTDRMLGVFESLKK